jgi:glutaredoxin
MKQTYTLASSEFCGPCTMVKKYLAENSIAVGIVNMEDDQSFFVENGIKTVPILLCSDGSRYAGADAILGHFSAKSVTC